MSPASRSKTKDKKAGKEPEKTPSKPSGFLHSVTGPVSGYNPLLGKFHALEASHISTPLSVNSNGRFRNIEETDDQTANSLETGLDFDAVSNNGSWSGESEDTKDKTSTHQACRHESVPGADNEKREKIRQKNERKHQRQKERRAQELHERCSGFLMSRKLEALAQQLVAMGFSSERATMALILNEGKIEESVAWLFEGVEEESAVRLKEPNNLEGGNLKIDITEELARIADMEVKYNCSKQEVERAVVACEGDIDKAAETLRLHKEEPTFVAATKPEETVGIQNSVRIQLRPPSLSASTLQQQQQQPPPPPPRKEEKNFNYTKAALPIGAPIMPPSTKTGILKLEWAKPQQVPITMEKRWPNGGGSTAPTIQAPPPPAKVEARYGLLSNELKNLQLGSIKEPLVVMQRPSQVIINNSQKQIVPNGNISSSPPPPPPQVSGWHHQNNNAGGMMMMRSGPVSTSIHNPTVSPSGLVTNKLYSNHLQQQQQHHSHHVMVDGPNQNRVNNNSSWNRMVGSSRTTLSAASSLGLFSGLGSNSSSSGSSSPIDWNTSSSMVELDYASVDWSLDRNSRIFGMWQGGVGGQNSNNGYHHQHPPPPPHNQNQTPGFGGGRPMRQMATTNGHPPHPGGISQMGGFQDSGGVVVVAPSSSASSGGEREGPLAAVVGSGGGGSREWASPFEEKDLFTLSRQFVSSPTL